MEIWFGDKVGFLTKAKIYAMYLYERRAKKENRDQNKGSRSRAGPGGRSSQREKEQGVAWLCTTRDASSIDRASQKQEVIETETQASTHTIYRTLE